MFASLRLLTGAIDYAGLFPPARLPLDQAVRAYLRHRTEPERWMLGRFVIPAVRLAELQSYREEITRSGAPLMLSALGRQGSTIREFLEGIAGDLEAILAFREHWGEVGVVDVLELRLPAELLAAERAQELATVLAGPAAVLEKAGAAPSASFFETDAGTGWRSRFDLLVRTLVEEPGRRLGFKLRCGGLDASAFPPPETVSTVLATCCRLRVPLKFTAGLHHPLRHLDAALQTRMHGFLNILVAGVLARSCGLDETPVQRIIEDEDASHFVFDDTGLGWQDFRATTEEILTARREAVTSFGSCSFDEPRDDLRALSLLD